MTPLTQIGQLVSGIVFFKRRRSTRHLGFLMLTCSSFAEVFLENPFHALQPAVQDVWIIRPGGCSSLVLAYMVLAHHYCTGILFPLLVYFFNSGH